MPSTRGSPVLVALAAIVVLLAAWLAARFWLADDPGVPSFAPARAVAFEPVPGLGRYARDAPRLRGRLVDDQGQPVADALLYARPLGVPLWTLSAADGRFELAWPSPGTDAPSGEETGAVEVDLVVAAWGFLPATFRARPGAEPLELKLPPREAVPTPVPRAQSAPLSGRIVRAAAARDARPFAYEVVLLPATPPQEFSGAIARRLSCAPDGSFTIPDLAHGSYRARVLPDWAEGGSWPDLLAADAPLLVHPAPGTGALLLPLVAGTLRGTALDSEGEPVEGALALLVDAARPARVWPPAASDAEGGFGFEDLPPGSYRLSLQAGEARLQDLSVEVAAGATSEVPLPALDLRAVR